MVVFSKIKRYLIEIIINLSLFKKLTLLFVIAILIPTFVIGTYSYFAIEKLITDEIVNERNKTLTQIENNINMYNMIAQNLCNKIVYNYDMINFLSINEPFKWEDVDQYQNKIIPFMEYTKQFNDINIYGLSIYSNNNYISENWNFFYKESRISNLDWYKKFKESKSTSMWLYPHNASLFDFYDTALNDNNIVFSLVKKINTLDGKYLGIVCLDIQEKDMFSSIPDVIDQDDNICVLYDDKKVYFSKNKADNYKLFDVNEQNFKNSEGHFLIGNNLYIYKDIPSIGLKIIYSLDFSKINKNFRAVNENLILIILFGLAIDVILTYLLLKVTYNKIFSVIKIMDKVVNGNTNLKIPVDRKDEVGQVIRYFNTLIEKINQLINDVLKKEVSQKDAQLLALQYQINPHFIYNVIDNFRMKMIISKSYDTANALTDFGKMLRYNLSSNSKYATINQEVEQVKNYFNLQKFTYGERIDLRINMPCEVQDFEIIRFILQPIVENSITHGLHNDKAGIDICLDIYQEKEDLKIVLYDNGAGINRRRLDILNYQLKYSKYTEENSFTTHGIGLTNINERLKLHYGNQYYLRLESEPNKCTTTTITIPYKMT